MNYFTLIEDIKRTSLQFAEEFYEGDVYEFLNSGNHKYPSIILTTQNVSTTDNINSISGTLFCVDRLTDDSSNRLEIQSNAFNKLQRIISALEENTINLQSNTYTPFTEKFADLCGGMFVEFNLQYVGESLCDDLEIKEIELTQNGIYDVIGYDRAIVNVRPVVNLEDITITDNGEYTCGEGFNGFGKVNVDLRGKVQVQTFQVTQDSIIDGKWIYEKWFDFSNGLTNLQNAFSNYPRVSKIAEIPTLNSWNVSNVTNLAKMFDNCRSIKTLDIGNWDVSNVTNMTSMFRSAISLVKLDLTKWSVKPNVTINSSFFECLSLVSLVGDYTIEEVINNNITLFEGIAINYNPFGNVYHVSKIARPTLRAIINGLADMSNSTAKTLTLGSNLTTKLTEEDIAIATAKNWTIA